MCSTYLFKQVSVGATARAAAVVLVPLCGDIAACWSIAKQLGVSLCVRGDGGQWYLRWQSKTEAGRPPASQ
jgi:hypothetical protein